MNESPKILIIRLSSLGDILHALPAFHSLREAYPHGRIDWLIERKLSYLLNVVDGIGQVIPIDTKTLRTRFLEGEHWRDLFGPMRTLRQTRYDIAIDFQGLLKTAWIGFMSGAKTRIGFPRDLVRERPAHWLYNLTVANPPIPMHVTRLNLLLAEAAGARTGTLAARLSARTEDTLAIEARLSQEQLSTFIVINPGGGWPTKRWPPARYGTLAARIQNELQVPVVVATGPGEESLYQEIAVKCAHRPPARFDVPFLQLIPLFERAQLVISGDTGPLHLACALGVPVVAIMGPTAPARNGPWSERDAVVAHPLACGFCYGRSCPTANECMDIPVEEVFDTVVRRLEQAE